MTIRRMLVAVPLALATACAPVQDDEEFASLAPQARIVGEAETCIPASRIRSTTVHDARTIDFRVGTRLYRNTLPQSCPGLRARDAITYDIRGGQLCRPEIVYVLENFGGELRRGAGCGLGDFVPIELVDEDDAEAG